MELVSRTPSAALSGHVSKLWYFAGPELPHQRERVLPHTEMQLLVNLHEDELRWWDGSALSSEHRCAGAAIGGLYSGPFAIDTAEQRRVVGAVLRPGAAPALLGVAADELTGQHTELDALGVELGACLRERLLEATTPQRILATLDAVLVRQLSATPFVGFALDRRISFARDALESGRSVGSIADALGWSGKRLRQCFAAAVGVTPKSYARVARLQRLLSMASPIEERRWAELAVDCGYYDQAHLILEFRSLTGLTPAAYRPRAPGDQNYVVLAS
jgi:AraC-like DNA-binding protein